MPSPIIGHLEHKPGLRSGDRGARGEVFKVIYEQRGWNRVGEQEVGEGGLGQVGLGEGPIIRHQESDVLLKCGMWGHV